MHVVVETAVDRMLTAACLRCWAMEQVTPVPGFNVDVVVGSWSDG